MFSNYVAFQLTLKQPAYNNYAINVPSFSCLRNQKLMHFFPFSRNSFLSTDERDAIQKKTFTKWVNKHLKKVIHDSFLKLLYVIVVVWVFARFTINRLLFFFSVFAITERERKEWKRLCSGEGDEKETIIYGIEWPRPTSLW